MPHAFFKDKRNAQLSKVAKVARASDDNHILYEWRIDVEQLYERKLDLKRGTVIGFDVAFLDRDGVNEFSYFKSSRGEFKHLHASRLGDLVIPSTTNRPAPEIPALDADDAEDAHGAPS